MLICSHFNFENVPKSFPKLTISPLPCIIALADSYVATQHALPQNISQFETPTLPQPAFDQQSLTQGKVSVMHTYYFHLLCEDFEIFF